MITLLIATITFPKGFGQYLAAEIDSVQQIEELFSNFSWAQQPTTSQQATIISHWTTESGLILWSLLAFFVFTVSSSPNLSTVARKSIVIKNFSLFSQ